MPIGMKNAAPRGAASKESAASRGAASKEKRRDSKAHGKQERRPSRLDRAARDKGVSDDGNEPLLDDYEEEFDEKRKPSVQLSGTTIGLVGVAVVLVVGTGFLWMKSNTPDEEQVEQVATEGEEDYSEYAEAEEDYYLYDDEGNPIYDSDGSIVNSDAIDPGYSDGSNTAYTDAGSAPATVYSAEDYIKDLNGVDVSAVYDVDEVTSVVDYVNYVKKRAIIDEGLEMYWVEVVYEGKKYRSQISFETFRYLKDEGICKMRMEVLRLSGGGRIISYMTVLNEDETEM